MSFIVSYNGQFSQYKLPDLSHSNQLHRIQKSNHIEEQDDPKLIDENQSNNTHTNVKKSQIGAYKKQEKEFKKQQKAYYAYDIMSSPVKCLQDTQPIQEAIKIMSKFSYRHIPILNDEGVLCGLLSERDLIGHSTSTKSIQTIMTPEVLTCYEQTKITDIASIMLHEKINSIPIINDQYKLTGIITQSDILKLVTKLFPLNTWS